MGYHGLYQINDMKLKPVELWLIKRLIAAVSSASCPPDSSASLSTPCGWQYHLSSRLSLTILSIQGWHYQTLDEDRHVSGAVYVDRHILSEAWNPGSHQIQSECPGVDPSPFFEYHWMCIPVSTLGLAQSRERRKKILRSSPSFSSNQWENMGKWHTATPPAFTAASLGKWSSSSLLICCSTSCIISGLKRIHHWGANRSGIHGSSFRFRNHPIFWEANNLVWFWPIRIHS